MPDATDSSAAFGRFSASVGSTNTSAAAYESAISASSTRCVNDQNERGKGGVSFAPATSSRNGSPFSRSSAAFRSAPPLRRSETSGALNSTTGPSCGNPSRARASSRGTRRKRSRSMPFGMRTIGKRESSGLSDASRSIQRDGATIVSFERL